MNIVNIPIWITDPGGNKNPLLRIALSTIFAAAQSAQYGNGPTNPPTVNGNIYYSNDGLSWNIATFIGVPSSGLDIQQLFCFQGMFTAGYAFTLQSSPLIQGFGWVTSTDGINWTRVCQANTGSTINFHYNAANNTFNYTSNAGPVPGLPLTIQNPNELLPTLSNNDMDQFNPLADPAQAGNATIPTNQISLNPLPSGFTAIRVERGGTPFQYTKDTLTNAIINSGGDWPAANWTTPPTWNSVVLGTNNGGCDVFYAAVMVQ